MSPKPLRPLILVVDDDETIRTCTQEVLEFEGYEVHAAAGASDALAYLHSAPRMPGIILLDMMMPGMDAQEFRARQMTVEKLAPKPPTLA